MKRRAITWKRDDGNGAYTFHLFCGHVVVKQYKEGAQVPWKSMFCPDCK